MADGPSRRRPALCALLTLLTLATLFGSVLVSGDTPAAASGPLTSQIFWANNVGGTIGSANLDGSGANESFITGANVPDAVATDGQYIYWSNSAGGGSIGRANLDGSNVNQSFITGANFPDGVSAFTLRRSAQT